MITITTKKQKCPRCGKKVKETIEITPARTTAIYRLVCANCGRKMMTVISSLDPDPVKTHNDFYERWNSG